MLLVVSRAQYQGSSLLFRAEGDKNFFKGVVGNWSTVRQIAAKLADLKGTLPRGEPVQVAFSPPVDIEFYNLGVCRLFPLSLGEQDEFWEELLRSSIANAA